VTIPLHVKVSAIGTLGSGVNETFTYGFNLAPYQALSSFRARWGTAPTSEWQAISDQVRLFHSLSSTTISPSAVIQQVKLALVGPDPANPNRRVYLEPPKVFGGVTTPATAGNSAILPQNALAISLRTGGLNKIKGRFFIPMPVVSVSPSDGWRMPAATAETIRNNCVNMLQNIAALPFGGVQGDLDPVIVSGPTPTNPNRGFLTVVNGVRVGRLVDTIQSRRRQLLEVYTDTSVVNV
jgi:hypothetical protein